MNDLATRSPGVFVHVKGGLPIRVEGTFDELEEKLEDAGPTIRLRRWQSDQELTVLVRHITHIAEAQ
jgi:hypothetical protein